MSRLTAKMVGKRSLIKIQGVVMQPVLGKVSTYRAYKTDFMYWMKMSYWTLDEGIALLLGLNPKHSSWDLMHDESKGTHLNPFIGFYSELRNIVLRAQEVQKITDPISPFALVEWAESVGIAIPEDLQEQIAIMKNRKTTAEIEKDNFLKEIAMLQNKIKVLEASVWQGFDEKESTYCKELAIAVKAYNAISKKDWKKGSSVKKQLRVWLEENHPELVEEEKKRISKLCNWQKSGGAPVTP